MNTTSTVITCIANKSNVSTPQNIATSTSTKIKNKTKNPTSSSALRRMTPLIISGYIFNTLVYFLIYALLPPNLTANAEYCPKDEPNCNRRDLFAFQVVSFINLTYLGLFGFYTFFISKRSSNALPKTPQGRYFGNILNKGLLLPESDYINAVIVIFQGWDFIASLFFEEHCTMIMMSHHVLAFICGFGCLWYEVNTYYAVYVGGVGEFSSIFLCVSQLFQYHPPSSIVSPSSSLSSILPVVELCCQGMFVVTFFLFRIVGWAQKSCMLLSDGSYIIKHGLLKRYSPGSGWFLWYLMTMSVLLGALQVYWFYEIVNKELQILNE